MTNFHTRKRPGVNSATVSYRIDQTKNLESEFFYTIRKERVKMVTFPSVPGRGPSVTTMARDITSSLYQQKAPI